MDRGRERPSRRRMSVGTIIRTLRPRNTAKALGDELRISPRQARRIIETDHVPGPIRGALVNVLTRAAGGLRSELDRIDDELKAIQYETMVSRAAARRDAMAAARDLEGDQCVKRPKVALVEEARK
jgi:hypothetical protein